MSDNTLSFIVGMIVGGFLVLMFIITLPQNTCIRETVNVNGEDYCLLEIVTDTIVLKSVAKEMIDAEAH